MNTYFSKLFSGNKYVHLILVAVIVTLTFFIYFNSFNNQFLNDWDDGIYITNNSDIKTLHGDSVSGTIKKMFTGFYNGHYHPVTMLVYGVTYNVSGLDARGFHWVNLFFHILTIVVVYYFVRLLVSQIMVAFITALLFAVHPMHVESVSWISDLKDILCTMFYVGAMTTYVLYLRKPENKYLVYTYLLFVLALLSKSMAITLPFVLIILELYLGKKWSVKLITAKIPMIVLSVFFGYLSILSQKSNNALGDITSVSFLDRILFSSYAVIIYIVKLFSFFDLSAFYNYPISENGKYPMIFYISPLLLVALLFVIYKVKWNRDVIWFGFLFFILTIALVLQLVPAGNVIMADRYTYLPYLGLFFIIASTVNEFITKSNLLKISVLSLMFVYVVVCSYVAYERTKVWHDSLTFWNDTIEKNPDAVLPYSNRAAIYIKNKQPDKAVSDLNLAIKIRPNYVTAHYNRGLALLGLSRFKEAIDDFTYVLQNNPRDVIAVYMNRANAYMYSGGYQEAIADYSSALKYNPNLTDAYYNRGVVYYTINQFQSAINDYNNALKLNTGFAQAYYLRALSLFKLQYYKEAMLDVQAAQQMGFPVDPNFTDELTAKLNQ